MNQNSLSRLLNRLYEAIDSQIDLVMMSVFTLLTEILFGIFIKGLLASQRAEIIGLSFVFGRTRCGCRVDIHSTNRVMNCICHVIYPFVLGKYYMS